MARAAYAADNARLSIDLKQNRDALSEATARSTRLSNELVAIRAAKLAAEQTIEERDSSIRELTTKIHKSDDDITSLTGNLSAAIRLAELRTQEIADREDKINRLGAEIEELRIDVATLDTEAENFKAQITELRNERRTLRDTLKTSEEAKQDLAFRLKRDESRLAEAESKLAKAIATLSDRENALDRRVAEMERLQQHNRRLAEELAMAKRQQAVAEMNKARPATPSSDKPRTSDLNGKSGSNITSMPGHRPARAETKRDASEADHQEAESFDLSESEKVDRLRARQAALTERLMKADNSGNDPALRREIATVAAMMVELTAGRDGKDSPIAKILAGSEDQSRSAESNPSLAARARQMIAASQSSS
uniref:Chromosome segregation ATPase n=1 Tax=uncultured organism TaxID=155900 RepID=A0A068FWA8_9ZZZZ|nr:chromosome segregation ATPase [uncultured organism]